MRLALLGDPVAHSRSPAIHRAALAEAGLEGDYSAIRADQVVLTRVVDELRSGLIHGVNVTMPLKGAAAAIADELTPLARGSGSVNTLRARRDIVEAHSTDALAFREIFEEESRLEPGADVLVLGSGGSARAVLSAVEGRRVYIAARSAEKAEILSARFSAAGALPWGTAVSGATLINATPIGMGGEELPKGLLEAASGLVDLPYGAKPTPAVASARAAGLPHVDGIEFLARQAGLSFRWWTGVSVDLAVLVRAARNA